MPCGGHQDPDVPLRVHPLFPHGNAFYSIHQPSTKDTQVTEEGQPDVQQIPRAMEYSGTTSLTT